MPTVGNGTSILVPSASGLDSKLHNGPTPLSIALSPSMSVTNTELFSALTAAIDRPSSNGHAAASVRRLLLASQHRSATDQLGGRIAHRPALGDRRVWSREAAA